MTEPNGYKCPTRWKRRFVSEEVAKEVATQASEGLGSPFRVYLCPCGSWHMYDQSKLQAKKNRKESRSARRKRAKRGEPPVLQALQEEQLREVRRFKARRQKVRKELPLRVWEDDGGA